jgi:hypothetical protein
MVVLNRQVRWRNEWHDVAVVDVAKDALPQFRRNTLRPSYVPHARLTECVNTSNPDSWGLTRLESVRRKHRQGAAQTVTGKPHWQRNLRHMLQHVGPDVVERDVKTTMDLDAFIRFSPGDLQLTRVGVRQPIL